MTKNQTTRRAFLKKTALAAGLPSIVPASVLGLNGKVAPSNRIVLGGIGLGPRGRTVLQSFLKQPDCQFVAIADPQRERREIIKRVTDHHYSNQDCALYGDMAEILGRDDIDAVVIATSDRWHATASIYAAQAGKDIYCEKPISMTISESQELDDAVLRHGRVFQAGTQRRSVSNFQLAAELALSGKLGNLKTVHAGIRPPWDYVEHLPKEPEPDPDDIHWDLWLGPAGWRPFNKNYCRGRWRRHKGLNASYGVLEWGSHTIDLCQWAVGADGTTPIEYEWDGNTGYAKYANGVKLVMREAGMSGGGGWIEGIGSCPARYEGDEGWVEAGDFYRIEVSNPKLLEGTEVEELAGTDPIHHVRNFLDCVKTREKPVSDSTTTRYGHVAGHAAAISWKLGRKLAFDPVTEAFINDDEANGMRSYERREPYKI